MMCDKDTVSRALSDSQPYDGGIKARHGMARKITDATRRTV